MVKQLELCEVEAIISEAAATLDLVLDTTHGDRLHAACRLLALDRSAAEQLKDGDVDGMESLSTSLCSSIAVIDALVDRLDILPLWAVLRVLRYAQAELSALIHSVMNPSQEAIPADDRHVATV